MAKLNDRLKNAISALPGKEKDKLLFRLVAKDAKLIRRLEFELLEGGETRDDRSQELRDNIVKNLAKSGDDVMTPGWVLMELRFWNARITEHVQATKDKEGEVALTLFMLNESLRRHRAMILRYPDHRSATLADYLVRRADALMTKAGKLHEDLRWELRKDMNELLAHIWAIPRSAKLAGPFGLPKEWAG
ncbi:MAG: hypothetical protein SFV52_00275 [Saprospiraceae bacterium]|nr:hypothetical protein [Saprospiraceae bacterium]